MKTLFIFLHFICLPAVAFAAQTGSPPPSKMDEPQFIDTNGNAIRPLTNDAGILEIVIPGGISITPGAASNTPVMGTDGGIIPVTILTLPGVTISSMPTMTMPVGTDGGVLGVNVTNTSIAVTGTFYQATQPVSWSGQSVAISGTVLTAPIGTDGGLAVTNISFQGGAVNAEFCASNLAGGSSYTVPVGTRAISLQNSGPNHVNCTYDGQTPTSALGQRIAGTGATPAETVVADAIGVDASQLASGTIKCIAATAAQSTGACIQVLSFK